MHVPQVSVTQLRGRKKFVKERTARIVAARHRIEFDTHHRLAVATAESRSFGPPKCLIRVMGNEMKSTPHVLIEIVVAGPDPVAVAIDEDILKRKKLECSIHIEQGLQGLFQRVGWCLLESPAELDQSSPGLWILAGLQCVDLAAGIDLFPEVFETH